MGEKFTRISDYYFMKNHAKFDKNRISIGGEIHKN